MTRILIFRNPFSSAGRVISTGLQLSGPGRSIWRLESDVPLIYVFDFQARAASVRSTAGVTV